MKILKFYADWCAPCESVSKMLGEMVIPHEVVEINIDKDFDMVSKYGIRGIPTIILLDDSNNVVKTLSGTITKKDLEILG